MSTLSVIPPRPESKPFPKVATVCVRGRPAKDNALRLALLERVAMGISARGWRGLDALLFPGGFFKLAVHVGQLSDTEREAVIAGADFGEACMQACASLDPLSSGVFLIAGVDSVEDAQGYREDQLCVAWNKYGIAGLGRKVFPIEDECDNMVCYLQDFGGERRVVTLPSGRAAILCACYDLFGCPEGPEYQTKRTTNIHCLGRANDVIGRDHSEFGTIRAQALEGWAGLQRRRGVTVGFAAIHRFARPGRDVFWQRHGIATASAAMLGGLAAGAAHFDEYLPDPNASTLVSIDVPGVHLGEARHRQAHRQLPADAFSLGDDALVRLYGPSPD